LYQRIGARRRNSRLVRDGGGENRKRFHGEYGRKCLRSLRVAGRPPLPSRKMRGTFPKGKNREEERKRKRKGSKIILGEKK